MAKKITLNDIAKILDTHGKEIRDLSASVAHVVKHMATKDDIADLKQELKGRIARAQGQVELHRSAAAPWPLRNATG